MLARLWSAILGIEDVRATDDFFLIGGHSLLAMRLLHRIHETFGVNLPPGIFHRTPVLQDLARRIDGEVRPPRTPPRDKAEKTLVQLESGAGGAPFFWVHGLGGEIFSYQALSRHLAQARPVYGFTADWTTMFATRSVTLDDIAAVYVAEMKAAAPHGPYHLGGFCGATPLVLEIAHQLEMSGDRVGAVAILDYDFSEATPRSFLSGVTAFVSNLPRWVAQDALPSGPGELWGRLLSGWRRTRKHLGGNGSSPIDVRDQFGMWRFPDHQVDMLAFHLKVLRSRPMKAFSGQIDLFLPQAAPLFGPWPPEVNHKRWTELGSGGLVIHKVRGSHATMIKEPFAKEIARMLAARIGEVDARHTEDLRQVRSSQLAG
jgi:thioesterase domain-containing protein